MRELSREFKVGKVCIGGQFGFMGCEVDVRDEIVELSRCVYMDKIVKIRRTEERSHQGEARAKIKKEE